MLPVHCQAGDVPGIKNFPLPLTNPDTSIKFAGHQASHVFSSLLLLLTRVFSSLLFWLKSSYTTTHQTNGQYSASIGHLEQLL